MKTSYIFLVPPCRAPALVLGLPEDPFAFNISGLAGFAILQE